VTLPSNQALSPNPQGVAAEVLDNEAIMINLATGIYYSMDGVGGSIWKLIEAGHTLEGIVAATAARYDAAPEHVAQDVRRVAEELVREGLITVSDHEPPGVADQEHTGLQKLPYRSPELKTYRDMGDLLALDPHVPGTADIPWKGG
jgi:Coenzyme PQQ synthesis protein D (PqqD)